MSNNTLILGLQWGDEGKGKIVDALAESSEAVCRFQGGHNAGHTLKVDGEQKVLHLVPSGILHPSVHCVLGNGLVLSLPALAKEIEELQESDINFKDRFYVSEDCSLILPTHIAIDQVRDKEEGIGTTGRGIGPAYEDKIARRAVRFGDLKNLEELKIKLSTLVNYHNQILQNLYNAKPIPFEDVLEELTSNIDLYNKYHCKTQDLLKLWVKQGKSILFEGAQGSMLDIDHGTYPYVTSSSTTAGGLSSGLGVGPRHIDSILGITKAYTTRVGSGPFPTELFDDYGKKMSKVGNEFGATTGRPRRCGWLDLVALKYACRINGVTKLMMMKTDVLSGFDKILVCTKYKYRGQIIDNLPYNLSDESLKPIYKELGGWTEDLRKLKTTDDFPLNLKKYIDFLETELKIPIVIVSVGPDRKETLFR